MEKLDHNTPKYWRKEAQCHNFFYCIPLELGAAGQGTKEEGEPEEIRSEMAVF